jgi:hypothetical protein
LILPPEGAERAGDRRRVRAQEPRQVDASGWHRKGCLSRRKTLTVAVHVVVRSQEVYFLDLKGSKGKPVLPTTRKGGPFLSESSSTRMFARFCRCITGHAPIGEYRSRFNIDGPVNCDCGLGILETRRHILGQCSKATRSRRRKPIDSVGRLNTFLDKNAWAFAFLNTPHIVWDPG